MLSLLVGLVLLILLILVAYIALGKLRVFEKIGKFTSSITDIFEDQNSNSEGDN